MNEFVNLVINRKNGRYENTKYFSEILFLYLRYSRFLDDDYALNDLSFYEYFIGLIERLSPFFWVILYDKKVSGFVYLDNIIGDSKRLHCAELTTCFDKAFWGDYTKYCAKVFLNHCFKNLGFKKIKALVYPQNFRVKTLLKASGFEKEGYLRCETLRNNRLQDIEIYSVLNKER